jgi:hypothetical protein
MDTSTISPVRAPLPSLGGVPVALVKPGEWTAANTKTRENPDRVYLVFDAHRLIHPPADLYSATGETEAATLANEAEARIHHAEIARVYVRSTSARTYFVCLNQGRMFAGFAGGWGYDRLAAMMHGVPLYLDHAPRDGVEVSPPVAVFTDHCAGGGLTLSRRNAAPFGLVIL